MSDDHDRLEKELEHIKGQVRATQDVTTLLAKNIMGKKGKQIFSKLVTELNKRPTSKKSSVFRAGYRAAVKKMAKDIVR